MLAYAVGDLHGEYDKLIETLHLISEDAGEADYNLIFLGDLIDRGPDSPSVVAKVKELCEAYPENVFSIMGNHEDLMIGAMEGWVANKDPLDQKPSPYENKWLANGGDKTLAQYMYIDPTHSLMMEHGVWLDQRPLFLNFDHHVFVHAGVNPSYPLDKQIAQELLWIRKWEDAWNSQPRDKHIVYGHSVFDEPNLKRFSSGLDTGSCFGNRPQTVGVFDLSKPGGPIRILQTGRLNPLVP